MQLPVVTLALICLGSQACHAPKDRPTERERDGAMPEAGEPDGGAAEVLGTGSVAVGDKRTPYELVRIPRGGGVSTYVQWIPSTEAGARSVVVMTQPYDGISWTGDPVDTLFSSAKPGADGFYPDVACAEKNDDTVAYAPSTPDSMAQSGVPFLINGHAVLLVYGRYYACDNLDGEILDMQTALGYLTSRPGADPTKVGIVGNSWGGFLALFGAAHAPAGVEIRVVSALNPPTDFEGWVKYTDGLNATWHTPSQLDFFNSYRRRVLSSSGGAPGKGDFTRYSHSALCEGLDKIPTLLLHDEWDTLVPFAQSTGLVDQCNKEGLWWPRQGPIDTQQVGLDHGLLGREPGYPSVFTFAQSYLLSRLNDAAHPVIALADRASLAAFLALIHVEQVAGGDVSWVAPRLRELSEPATLLFLVKASAAARATEVLTQLVNAEWGTALDEAGLRTQLATGLPPP